ncbi:MAG: UDP-N-acetylmuramoyl-L-alanine--D-glutamate ligase [Legionella sp.]|nr:UDP-N-acetylmuramoyl-L-alanine--D-glutamate ligase [Legionella sp.]
MNQSVYLVAGIGKTGRSIAAFLRRRNLPFVVFDTRTEVEGLTEFTRDFPGVDIFLGELPPSVYPELKAIIASPGVAMDDPVFAEVHRLKIPVIGDIECFAREVRAPVIAITGTNGKSTVTTLVGEMARAAGLEVAVAGNIGLPVLDLIDSGKHYDLWVLELSSFQLDLIDSLAPVAATVLNISPDHLDRHHSLAAYSAAKQRIYRQAKVLIHSRDDNQTYPVLPQANLSPVITSFGLDEPTGENWGIIHKDGKDYLSHGDNALLAVDELRLKGKQNWQNVLAACALAHAAGIEPHHMLSVLRTFSGLPHRCQWVRTLDGVDWINDSKGTNVGATISAISGIGGSIKGQIVLIAGGLGKGADFSEMQAPVNEFVRAVVLIGKDADSIEKALDGVVPVFHANSLEAAMLRARSEAKSGDVVLLSPACASQDMFRDFNHRGESFANLAGLL